MCETACDVQLKEYMAHIERNQCLWFGGGDWLSVAANKRGRAIFVFAKGCHTQATNSNNPLPWKVFLTFLLRAGETQ